MNAAVRITMRCPACQLNQFITADKLCRKCSAPLLPDAPGLVAVEVEMHPESKKPPMRATQPEGILARAEKTAIDSALEITGNNKSLAARALGIGKTTLYRKLRIYKLEAEEEKRNTPAIQLQAGVKYSKFPPEPVQPKKDLGTLYEELINKGVLLADKIVGEKLR